MKVPFVKMYPDVITPNKAHECDACWDIYVHSLEFISKNQVTVHTGLKILPPKGYSGVLKLRSSATKYNWILINSPGTIDQYTGEWLMKFTAIPTQIKFSGFPSPYLSYDEFPYCKGDRCGQFEFNKIEQFTLVEVEELEDTNRGIGGYGSTGK